MSNTKNYTTIQGDRWDLISYREYGSLSGIGIIVNANPTIALDPVLSQGINLIIPIVDDSESAIVTKNVPPWKR